MALQYKTRGKTSAQGKPRVYFCCHPEDHALYFERICADILKTQNCAIWYKQDPADPTEDALLEDLKQMQLVVIPITAKLLQTPNAAMDVDFPFAMDQHIPVLPLMLVEGMDDLFNKRFGDMQYLDMETEDQTVIDFHVKLEKFLSSVLISDDMAQKIRQAFDAYVFLSYRKKDRKYAQELMRLIHQNDFCRDIAL